MDKIINIENKDEYLIFLRNIDEVVKDSLKLSKERIIDLNKSTKLLENFGKNILMTCACSINFCLDTNLIMGLPIILQLGLIIFYTNKKANKTFKKADDLMKKLQNKQEVYNLNYNQIENLIEFIHISSEEEVEKYLSYKIS